MDKLCGGMRRRLLIARALVHQPELVLLDEPTVGLDPQVRQELWGLIDDLRAEGVSILMSTHYIEEAERLADTVLIMAEGKAVAEGQPAELVRELVGAQVTEVYGPRRGWTRSRPTCRAAASGRAAPARASRSWARERANGELPEEARRASPTSRTSSSCSPGSGSTEPIERAGITGVLVREVINFGTFWRSSTFSAIVQPIVYLLAFGFGFGTLVDKVGGIEYMEFVGLGTVATAVLFSSIFSGIFGTLVKWKYQRTYDALLAAPVSVEEIVTAESLWIGVRSGVYGCAPLIVTFFFGLEPSWGMLLVPFIGTLTGFGFAAPGCSSRRSWRPSTTRATCSGCSSPRCSCSPGRSSRSTSCRTGRSSPRRSTRSTTASSSSSTPRSASRPRTSATSGR